VIITSEEPHISGMRGKKISSREDGIRFLPPKHHQSHQSLHVKNSKSSTTQNIDVKSRQGMYLPETIELIGKQNKLKISTSISHLPRRESPFLARTSMVIDSYDTSKERKKIQVTMDGKRSPNSF
jgi:hypothetical protein